VRQLTVAIYALFGTLALIAGLVALVAPSAIVAEASPSSLISHLTREEGASFVFIGLMFFWCISHYEQRRPVHFAFLVFIVLFAGIHWHGYLQNQADIMSPIINTIPVLLLAVTAPFARKH
jgi:uncharacterized membrane protein